MNPKIIDSRQIILMGFSFYGDPFDVHAGWDEQNQIGQLWKRLSAYLADHEGLIDQAGGAMYEVHIYNEETRQKGYFEVFAGLECSPSAVKDVPADLLIKVLPDTMYAVFTFHGEEITADWEKTLQDWLDTSGYLSSALYNFQYYDGRFKGMDKISESELDVYVPVIKA